MSDTVNILKRTSNLNVSPKFTNYSKVIIHIDDENEVVVGDDSGRTFEIDNPICSADGARSLAERILAKLRGYQYQPYEADGAIIDPAVEVGDGVTVNNVYGGIYKNDLKFSRLMKADISAPHEEEIDNEYTFETPTERKFKRELGDVKASLIVQANEIRAEVAEKVDAEGGTQSFGWKLLSDRWSITSNGKEIFTVDANGGTFTGKVVAASGTIGGFEITATSISNFKNGRGVWISTVPWDDGTVFQVGSGFKVSSDGSLTANNGTFGGTVKAGSIQYGGNNGYMSGGGIAGGTVGTSQMTTYCAGGIGGGVSFANATNMSGSYPSFFRANQIYAMSDFRALGSCMIKGRFATEWKTDSWTDADGNYHFIRYLAS